MHPYHQKRLTSSPFAWWPQPIPVHLLPFMNFNSLYLSVLKSPSRLRVSDQPLQIDWESGSAVFIENSLFLFTHSAIRVCAFLIHTNGKALAKEDSIVLALSCPMTSNIHLWNTSENFCPRVATVVNPQREREERQRECTRGGGVDFISLGHASCVFKAHSKSQK